MRPSTFLCAMWILWRGPREAQRDGYQPPSLVPLLPPCLLPDFLSATYPTPGTAQCSKDSGSQAMSDWCQWLVSKGLNWQSMEGSEREPGSHPNFPNQNQHRREPEQGQGDGRGARGAEWVGSRESGDRGPHLLPVARKPLTQPLLFQMKPCSSSGLRRRKPNNGNCSQLGMGWEPTFPALTTLGQSE